MKQSNESLSKIVSKIISVVNKLSKDSIIQAEAEKCLQDKLQQKHKKLKEITSNFNKMISSPNEHEFFFPVDNFKGTNTDINEIHKHLLDMFNSFFNEDACSLRIRPVQLLFGIVLRKEFKIVSLEECFKIGRALNMDQSEVAFTIWYLHNCEGALFYYPDIKDDWFKNNVICDPNVIFNSISALIVEPLLSLHSPQPKFKFTNEEKEQWKQKGQFSLATIKRCQSKLKKDEIKKELINADKLVILLEHTHIAAPVIDKESGMVYFFMPAILKCASNKNLFYEARLEDPNTPFPIKLTFKSFIVPIGLFCMANSRLVSEGPKQILGLEWNIVDSQVMRNLISFKVDSAEHFVTLVAHADCYEIRLTRCDDIDMHKLCSYVLTTILFVLNDVSRNSNPIIAFDCHCPRHVEERAGGLCKLKLGRDPFFKCEHDRVNLLPQQEIWFTKEANVNDDIDLIALQFFDMAHERDLSFKWMKEGETVPGESGNKLTLKNVSTKQAGNYTCEVLKNDQLCFKTLCRLKIKHQCEETAVCDDAKDVQTLTEISGHSRKPPLQGDRPTMQVLRNLKINSERKIDLATEIGTKYKKVGLLLLDSDTKVKNIEASKQGVVEDIVHEILSEWLKGGSKTPVTWETLITVLRDCGLGTLADDVSSTLMHV